MSMRASFKALALEVLTLFGLLIFAKGFLPPTRTKLGFSVNSTGVPPQFERVVFMVVDAMRSDFLFSSESPMHNTHELLRNGFGYAFTAFSDPPTVTLPRLKGLTTGASPNFLDAVINIAESDSASTLANQDSWIHQLKAHGKRLHLFGDDTWLKLFPQTFDYFDGTSSFYVADFTEVDNNVTRHLDAALAPRSPVAGTAKSKLENATAWDALVLHYLGLDHIGHKGGPQSIYMPAKQREMDEVIRRIFDSLDDSTLFVVAGDHGMNDVGNHGGASVGETSAALAFFAKKFRNRLDSPVTPDDDYSYYARVNQIDLVPTLAILLGFPIPKNSLGLFIDDFLPLWGTSQEQDLILRTICEHLEIDASENLKDACSMSNLKNQQRQLIKESSVHILKYMYCGLALLVLCTCVCLALCYTYLKQHQLMSDAKNIAMILWWLILPVLYFAGMLGSSTVEEEHYIWYWSITGMFATLFFAASRLSDKVSVLLALGCFRVIRGWNTAGQKWAALSDTAEVLANHQTTLWVLTISTFAFLYAFAPRRTNASQTILMLASFGLSLGFKYSAVRNPVGLPWVIWLARAAFASAILDALIGSGAGLVTVFILQTRLENIPMWIPIVFARSSLAEMFRNPEKAHSTQSATSSRHTAFSLFGSLITLSFEYSCFFAMGGSNSLATIDLSNAYNGVSGYNIPLVALLTYLGNWSAPLYWATSLQDFSEVRIFRALFYSVACTSVTLACLVLREHLFIWTVFSPKLLYVGAWLLFHELLSTTLVNTGVSL